MKKKTFVKKVYSFHSISDPNDFIARAKVEAVKSDLKIEQTENGFLLQLGWVHGGKVVYQANVSADENGSSFISGEIITIPLGRKSEKKNFFDIIMTFLASFIIVPLVLLYMLGYGICLLFVRLFHGKSTELTTKLTDEEKLCDFMTNKMCCNLNGEI